MRGFDSSSYGDRFADVYDDWYANVSDVDATVSLVAELAGPGGSILELGVGTGRLAVPMADAGLSVVGIDSSRAMLERLAERDLHGLVRGTHGDMVDDLPDQRFDVVLVAYNTLFNLVDDGAQATCFVEVAKRLVPSGVFVVEAFVPDDDALAGSEVSLRSMTADSVVLSISRQTPGAQHAEGQFVELTETGGVRLRPWQIKSSTVAELDTMAADAGMRLESRWASMSREPFGDDATAHVSVYRLADEVPATDG